MARHRSPGEGYISQKPRADGRWTASLDLGTDSSGKHLRWYGYGRTKKEARDKLDTARRDRAAGTLILSPRVTLADFLTQWLEATQPTVEPKWFYEVNRYVTTVLIPRLGTLRLADIKPADCQRFVGDLQREGRSAHWIAKAHGRLRHALNDAVRWQLILSNPAIYTKLPKIHTAEKQVWAPGQVGQFLAAVAGDDDAELYLLAILTGARSGELLALTWLDVDWQAPALTIQRSVSRVPTVGLVVKEPKTKAGRRLIALDDLGTAALLRQKARLEFWREYAGWQEHGLIFPKRNGCHRTDEGPRRKLERVAAGLGLPVLTFHELRHLHGSLLVALGVPLKVIQVRLGHSSVDVTGDLYSHILPGLDGDAASKLGLMLSASIGQPSVKVGESGAGSEGN